MEEVPQHLMRINPDVVIAWEYNPSARKHCSGASATAGSSSTSRTARCIRSGTSGACRSSCGISSSVTPIVASKYADGAYDTVHPGENGLIVDPEDADALEEAIDSILSSEEIQRRYSQNCRQYIPQFEFKAVIQGYLQAIASVTSGNE